MEDKELVMRRVFLSFLGLGQKGYGYRKTIYEMAGQRTSETRFVQVAEQELLGWEYFDILYIVATKASKEAHFAALEQELSACRGDVCLIELEEDMSGEGQWGWFERIYDVIQEGDELCVDLTHGYRSIPIIFSTAIYFLYRTKRIRLQHVLYGAFEKDRQLAPIIDMRRFFDINLWADAVGRLTDDADAESIARLAGEADRHQFPELATDDFVSACIDVTRRIKSVDVNNVAEKSCELLHKVGQMKENSSSGTARLLELVHDKFSPLAHPVTGNPDKSGYTLDYYRIQLELARLLLGHGLFMQAFTVMREWLSSLVMLYFEEQGKMNANKRRKRNTRYGGILFDMLQFPEKRWNFGSREEEFERVHPFYEQLERMGALEPLIDGEQMVAHELSKYRNGFDHAWLGKAGMNDDLENKGEYFLERLERVFGVLEVHDAFSTRRAR